MYCVKMMSGEKFEVSDEEFKDMATAKGSVFIPSLNVWVNMSSVSTMYPLYLSDIVEDKKTQMNGVLRDGTRVRKHFGQWVLLGNDIFDDFGNPQLVVPSPEYYPEIAGGYVMSEKENDQYRLSDKSYDEFMNEKKSVVRINSPEPESIKSLLEEYANAKLLEMPRE